MLEKDGKTHAHTEAHVGWMDSMVTPTERAAVISLVATQGTAARKKWQKKDYELVALLLYRARMREQHAQGTGILNDLIDEFADVFEHDSRDFNRARFEAACRGLKA